MKVSLLAIISFLLGAAAMFFIKGQSNPSATPVPLSGDKIKTIERGEGITGTFNGDTVAISPQEEIEKSKLLPGRRQRELQLSQIFEKWGRQNGPEGAGWVEENLKGIDRMDALISLAEGWAESNPSEAADWFNTNTSGLLLEDTLIIVLETWGMKDGRTALRWTSEVDDYTKSAVMDSLGEGWAAVDPNGAATAGLAMLDKDYGDEFLMKVAGQWASNDPDSAAAWAAGLPNGEAKLVASLEIGSEWGMRDPQAAKKWVESIAEAENRGLASYGLAIGWAEHDPGAALLWSATSDVPQEQQQRAIEDIMLNWASSTPNSAAAWLNENIKNPNIDRIITTFTESIIEQDPYAAVQWAQVINDPLKQERHLNEILSYWVEIDAQEATQWIQSSDLSDSMKENFKAP